MPLQTGVSHLGDGPISATTGALGPMPLVVTFRADEPGRRVDFEVIPKLLGAAAAGGPTADEPRPGPADPVQMDQVGELAFSFEWLRRNLHFVRGELASVHVRGDSMAPTLMDGDTIVIDRGEQEIEVDGIYVLDIYGRRLVKRVQRFSDGTVVLISDNAAYAKETHRRDGARDIRVIGRMVWPRVR